METNPRRFPRVLIVGDEQSVPTAFLAALHRGDLSVDRVADGLSALSNVREHQYAVILVDLTMPRMNAPEFLRAYGEIQSSRRAVVFVMTTTGDRTPRVLDSALVHGCVRKPFDVAGVALMVRDCAALFESGPSVRLADECRALRLVHEH